MTGSVAANHLAGVTVDCNEPQRVVDFWSALLDSEVTKPGADRSG